MSTKVKARKDMWRHMDYHPSSIDIEERRRNRDYHQDQIRETTQEDLSHKTINRQIFASTWEINCKQQSITFNTQATIYNFQYSCTVKPDIFGDTNKREDETTCTKGRKDQSEVKIERQSNLKNQISEDQGERKKQIRIKLERNQQ